MKWPEHLHRPTFYAVFIADAILLPVTMYLASNDIKSWAIALPVFALNLPATPLFVLASVLGSDFENVKLSSSAQLCVIISYFVGTVLISSGGWAFVVEKATGEAA